MALVSECSQPGCSQPARFRCSACKASVYCSREHQAVDWKSGRHALVCSSTRVNDELGQQQPEFVLGLSKDVTPNLIDAYFVLSWIASGQYGAVFRATTRGASPREYALKVESDDFGSGGREAAVGTLMTVLYAAGTDPQNALLPVIKVYDSGIAEWTRDELEQFLVHLPQSMQARFRDYAFPDENEIVAPINIMLMELAENRTLASFLQELSWMRQPGGHRAMLDILVQVLLTLSDLQTAFEFVHYDLHSYNIMVVPAAADKRYVWHYTASSDTVFNVRSDKRPQLIDFGFSRLRYKHKLFFSPASVYGLDPGGLREYRPWTDLISVGAEFIRLMGRTLYDLLVPSSPLLQVLAEMFSMEVVETPESQSYRILQAALQAKLHSGPQKISHTEVVAAAAGARSSIVQPKPDVAGATAHAVLRECKAALVEYISYAPTDAETIVDMTLHIGRESLATKSAWKAVEKKGARTWFEAADSP